eukprot:TRINITY_DN166_c0_g2_i1.p1 TRINITY_DN166_c0_g2~~TRINITY_DN166_c0_g2_i1.p1  ORF type:complete len:306 (-),score=57.26 TRINITY_DN166_c0_g2_i1:80-997(-)
MTTIEDDGVWSVDVEEAFQEAMRLYPRDGRTRLVRERGQLIGHNEIIARHILRRTGKHRTRKQVSSHLQVLSRRQAKAQQRRHPFDEPPHTGHTHRPHSTATATATGRPHVKHYASSENDYDENEEHADHDDNEDNEEHMNHHEVDEQDAPQEQIHSHSHSHSHSHIHRYTQPHTSHHSPPSDTSDQRIPSSNFSSNLSSNLSSFSAASIRALAAPVHSLLDMNRHAIHAGATSPAQRSHPPPLPAPLPLPTSQLLSTDLPPWGKFLPLPRSLMAPQYSPPSSTPSFASAPSFTLPSISNIHPHF